MSTSDGHLVISKMGSFPKVSLQSRGDSLTIYEFGARSMPYVAETVLSFPLHLRE